MQLSNVGMDKSLTRYDGRSVASAIPGLFEVPSYIEVVQASR